MKKLSDYIVVINNAATPALCDAILKEYKESSDWITACVISGEDTNIRHCDTIGMSFDAVINKNRNERLTLDKYMHVSAGAIIKQYRERFKDCSIEQDSGYDLLRYQTGRFYKTHTDSFKDRPRAVSCSFALNDDYEGGEFAFFDRELVYKLKKGDALMFPSNFMYPHEVMPVTSGTRYSIVTWFV